MSTPNDDLPLDNRAGNFYDPLFAARIDALAKSSGGRPAPSQPGGNGSGAGWPAGIVILSVILLRGCAALTSSSSRSSGYDTPAFNANDFPTNEEEQRKMEELLQRANEVVKPPLERRPPEEVLREMNGRLDREQAQQPVPPAAPDEPDHEP